MNGPRTRKPKTPLEGEPLAEDEKSSEPGGTQEQAAEKRKEGGHQWRRGPSGDPPRPASPFDLRAPAVGEHLAAA